MTTPGEPTKLEIEGRIRELLGRATLARARGRYEQALTLVQEAINLSDANAEAHELKGDLLLAQNRGAGAMTSFRRALELHPDRAVLEDKIARAALQTASVQQTLERSQALLEGRAQRAVPKRNPGYAALLSLIAPGLGQLYNGEILKALVLLMAYVFLFAVAVLRVLRELAAGPANPMGAVYGPQFNVGTAVSALSGGAAVVVTVALLGLWIYAIGDAAFRASRTMTSDDTGLV